MEKEQDKIKRIVQQSEYLQDYENKLSIYDRHHHPLKPIPDWVTKDDKNSRRLSKEIDFGDYILFQEIGSDFTYSEYTDDQFMEYPRFGIYVGATVIDMAIERFFVQQQRSRDWRINHFEKFDLSDPVEPKMRSTIDWFNTICIFGHWKNKPNWKEMKKAYERTFWYGDLERRRKLKKLLNE